MNRFFDITGINSRELLPQEIVSRGYSADIAYFELLEPLRFKSDIAGGTITLPVGFLSDLASIPAMAAWFMTSDSPKIAAGAWIHDYLYANRGEIPVWTDSGWIQVKLTRAQCDAVLAYEAMPDLMASKAQQTTVYQVLRRFGNQWPQNGFMERLQG